MAFNLAEAFVSLTNEGFDQTITSTDGVEASLRKLMSGADAATDSVDSGLVEAMAAAAGEMLNTAESADEVSERLGRTKAVLSALQSQIASMKTLEIQTDDKSVQDALAVIEKMQEVVVELNDTELVFLGGISDALGDVIAAREETKRLTEAVEAYDASAGKPKKSVQELNAEIEKAKKATSATVKEMEKLSDAGGKGAKAVEALRQRFEDGRGSLDSLKEKTESFVAEAAKGPSKFAKMAGSALRLAGVITAVAGAASKVYDWVLKWQLEASGFNAENERALVLVKKIGEQQSRVTADAIRGANNLVNKRQTIIALEEKLQAARVANDDKQANKREKEEALTPGTFGQFADGKVNAELVPEFERAEAAANASQKSVEMLEKEIRRIKIAGQDFELGVARDLQRAKILANEGEDALREFDLVAKGMSKNAAAAAVAEERQLKTQEERKQAGKALADNYKLQLQALELQTVALTQGAEAAAKRRDANAGFNETQREGLAAAREANRAAVEANKKKEESKRLAEEEEKRQNAIGKSFTQQANALVAKNIALSLGVEKAEQFKDEAKGFNEQQRGALAVLRERNRLLADFDKAKKEEQRVGDETKNGNGGFVGFAELAKAGGGNEESRQAQIKTAEATAALVRQATGEGLKIKELATSAPKVDRRFGKLQEMKEGA